MRLTRAFRQKEPNIGMESANRISHGGGYLEGDWFPKDKRFSNQSNEMMIRHTGLSDLTPKLAQKSNCTYFLDPNQSETVFTT